jgi:membrane protein implicated in regulation of membrane protease activity
MPWWAWLILGFALLGGEMLAPGGLYLLFGGIAALIVGGLTLARLSGPEWTQWLLFSGIAVISLVTLRNRLAASVLGDKIGGGVVGQTIDLTSRIEPDGVGTARLRGSTWKVHNAGPSALAAGTRCRVDDVNGITLTVGRSSWAEEEIDA